MEGGAPSVVTRFVNTNLLPEIKQALKAGEIVSIIAPIDVISEEISELALDEKEKIRLNRFRGKLDKQRYRSAHTLKRIVLADFLQQSYCDLQFLSNAQGKPYCTHPRTPFFNLTHAGAWVAVTVCCKGEVGVDLEFARACEQESIIQKLGSPKDIENYRAANDSELAFLCFWTQKEALAKTVGKGLMVSARELSVSCRLGQSIALDASQNLEYFSLHWNEGVLTIAGAAPAVWRTFELGSIVENNQQLSLLGDDLKAYS